MPVAVKLRVVYKFGTKAAVLEINDIESTFQELIIHVFQTWKNKSFQYHMQLLRLPILMETGGNTKNILTQNYKDANAVEWNIFSESKKDGAKTQFSVIYVERVSHNQLESPRHNQS